MPRTPIDWDLIKLRFEAGETAYKISKTLGGRPSKQAIHVKAQKHEWKQQDNALTVAGSLPIVERARSLTGPTKCTAERVGFILDLVARGSSEKLASSAAGINPATLKRWKTEDPQLAEQLRQARAGKMAEWISHIDHAAKRDWKAADRLLQASPEAEDFSAQQHGGITIVLNIDREQGTIIDGSLD